MEDLKDGVVTGAFETSLKRNNSKIREDRAVGIAEDAQITYQRKLEDMKLEIKRLARKRENMLDLSPTNADSLMLAEDFQSSRFVDEDIRIGVDIRNLEITIEIAQKRYDHLFGTKI